MPHILVIEDNPDMGFGLRSNLELEGYDVTLAEDGLAGLRCARELNPDLVVLDLTMPGMDGYRVLRTLREEGRDMPVLILSARDQEADKVRGFRLGADDFVTKPFGLLELIARVQALLRRAGSAHAQEPGHYEFGDVHVDVRAQRVTRGGTAVELTPRAFDLLMALLRRSGGVVTREELLRDVWGFDVRVETRTVDWHVMELRRKLETDPANPRHILTVRKTGYRLQA